METLYRVPFAVLECPNVKLKRPSWVHMPSAMTVYALVVVSYFLITGGIIYDVIVEPPSVGSMTDEHGHQRPVAFLAYRVNGQYIMEGLASSFLFTMGGLGFIILDRSNAPNIPKLNRFLLLFIGFVSVLLSFFMARVFMRMKLPGYLMAFYYLPFINGNVSSTSSFLAGHVPCHAMQAPRHIPHGHLTSWTPPGLDTQTQQQRKVISSSHASGSAPIKFAQGLEIWPLVSLFDLTEIFLCFLECSSELP
ncbi:oligosaccharyltransferase complex subunit OSTC [Alligator mississippiensis]|uniref:Oligosaccharyltransferase complex subunit n=1 Tax=Alligator mississippiensis TaxID=8496 RepID=A0A151MIW3_ALLMI|nr:oligosaccharyltransferase complex subunit OSTC [Alligator mississippiensis]